MKITTGYLQDDESTEADDKVKQALVSGIESFTNLDYIEDEDQQGDGNFIVASSSKVGATIADDIKNSSDKVHSVFSGCDLLLHSGKV